MGQSLQFYFGDDLRHGCWHLGGRVRQPHLHPPGRGVCDHALPAAERLGGDRRGSVSAGWAFIPGVESGGMQPTGAVDR